MVPEEGYVTVVPVIVVVPIFTEVSKVKEDPA